MRWEVVKGYRFSDGPSEVSFAESTVAAGGGADVSEDEDDPARGGAAVPLVVLCGVGDADATRWSSAFSAIALDRHSSVTTVTSS